MTALLDQALAEVQRLPPEQQDAIAALILEELADEATWNAAFAASATTLAKLAAKARADKRAGKVHTVRFLNQFTNGMGNYTRERDQLFKDVSLDTMVTAMQPHKTPAEDETTDE